MDLGARDFGIGFSQLFKIAGRYDAGKQTDNEDDNQEFEQGKSGMPLDADRRNIFCVSDGSTDHYPFPLNLECPTEANKIWQQQALIFPRMRAWVFDL